MIFLASNYSSRVQLEKAITASVGNDIQLNRLSGHTIQGTDEELSLLQLRYSTSVFGVQCVTIGLSSPGLKTYFNETTQNRSSTITLRTVTPGKTGYVTGITFSGFNLAPLTAGDIRLRDGTGDVLFPILLPVAENGFVSPSVMFSRIFDQPLVFFTSIRLIFFSGQVSCSAGVSGYEQ